MSPLSGASATGASVVPRTISPVATATSAPIPEPLDTEDPPQVPWAAARVTSGIYAAPSVVQQQPEPIDHEEGEEHRQRDLPQAVGPRARDLTGTRIDQDLVDP